MAISAENAGRSPEFVDHDPSGAGIKVVESVVLDSTGKPVNPDNFAQVMTYNADGTLATIAFSDGAGTLTKTLSYTAGNLTGVGAWVRS